MRTLRRYLASEVIAATGLVMLALLIFMSYSNLLSITQAQVAQSRLHFAAALAVHAAMLVLAAALFYRRLMVVPLRRLFG